MFLTLMVIGLSGLVVMAIPAFARHALHPGHTAGLGHVPKLGPGGQVAAQTALAEVHAGTGWMRLVPSPRLVFSLLALFGAFANALVAAAGLTPVIAALVAAVPAIAVERFAVTPIWRLASRFGGVPSSRLEACILSEATAVTPFRNGRGVVSLVRDGRLVQFSARLVDAQAHVPVRVGDVLQVEDVDARRERLTVSVPEG